MVGLDADDGEVAPATANIELEAAATADTEQERAAADFENQQAETTHSTGPYNVSDMDIDVDLEEMAREKTGHQEEDELQETEDDKRLTDNAPAETGDRQTYICDDSCPGPIAEHITNIRLCHKEVARGQEKSQNQMMASSNAKLPSLPSASCVQVQQGETWWTKYSMGRIWSNGAWFLSYSYKTWSGEHHILTKPTPATWPERHHPISALVLQDSISPFRFLWPGLLKVLLSIHLQFEAMCMQKKWHSVEQQM